MEDVVLSHVEPKIETRGKELGSRIQGGHELKKQDRRGPQF